MAALGTEADGSEQINLSVLKMLWETFGIYDVIKIRLGVHRGFTCLLCNIKYYDV